MCKSAIHRVMLDHATDACDQMDCLSGSTKEAMLYLWKSHLQAAERVFLSNMRDIVDGFEEEEDSDG